VLLSIALHAMYDTVHRALINRYTHTVIAVLQYVLQDPRNQLNFYISGLVQVDCTEALYNDNPEIQNSVEIGDLAVDQRGI
jgi:hypothetical protein